MGPTIIFDKSFLQSISVDESVFLSQFFITNVTPLFYIETLGDLDLGDHKSGKPISKVISELSKKVPDDSEPNVFHLRLILGDLLGYKVEMDGRMIITGGEEKTDPDGNIGLFFKESSEQLALRRWHGGEFYEIERDISHGWREMLSNMNFDSILGIIKNIVPEELKLSNSVQVLEFVDNFLKTTKIDLLLYLILELTGLPHKHYQKMLNRWNDGNFNDFNKFAPYAFYILRLNLFFYICMLRGLESKNRPSHIIDLAYLYYLPFCNVFVSSDKLHKRIAPLFIRPNQMFVYGVELKNGFAVLNTYYEKYIDEINEKGFISFAHQPPKDIKNIVSDIWDFIFPNWRDAKPSSLLNRDPEEDKKLLEHLKNVQNNSVKSSTNIPTDQVHHIVTTHKFLVQKGKWRILPKGIENNNDSK